MRVPSEGNNAARRGWLATAALAGALAGGCAAEKPLPAPQLAPEAFEHGTATGSGAFCSWEGNGKVGAGKMTITASRPNDLVRSEFEFHKPLRCRNTHEFALKQEGSQTIVTWTVNGTAPFLFKLFLVFASADKMMGENLERGLDNLKKVIAG